MAFSFCRTARRLTRVETKDSAINRAMAAEIKAERVAQDMTIKDLAKASGVPEGTLNRMTSKDIRDINITQMALIAEALGMSLADLVTRAEARAERISASEARVTNVLPLRKRNLSEMTVAEIEGIHEKAAYRDPEANEDEHFD